MTAKAGSRIPWQRDMFGGESGCSMQVYNLKFINNKKHGCTISAWSLSLFSSILNA